MHPLMAGLQKESAFMGRLSALLMPNLEVLYRTSISRRHMLMVYSHKIKIPIVIQSQSCRPLEKGRGKAAGWMRRSRGASTLFTQLSTLPFPRTAKACDGATAGLSIQESSPIREARRKRAVPPISEGLHLSGPPEESFL